MLSVVEYCFRNPACDSSITLLFSAYFCSLIVKMFVNILLILFIKEIPLKFSRFDMFPLLCIGHMIFSLHSGGKIPVIYFIKENIQKW